MGASGSRFGYRGLGLRVPERPPSFHADRAVRGELG